MPEQQQRHAVHQARQECQRGADWIEVEPIPLRAESALPVDQGPHAEHGDVGHDSLESSDQRAFVEHEDVSGEIRNRRHRHLSGGERERKQQRTRDDVARPATAAPVNVEHDAQHAEARRNQCVPVRQVHHGHRMRIVDGIEQRRQSRNPGGTEDPAVQKRYGNDHRRQPEQTVQVHQRRLVWPELVVEERGHRARVAEEREMQGLRRPPRERARVHLGLGVSGDPVVGNKDLERLRVAVAQDPGAVEVIVELPAGRERRDQQQWGQHREGQHPPPVGQGRLDSARQTAPAVSHRDVRSLAAR